MSGGRVRISQGRRSLGQTVCSANWFCAVPVGSINRAKETTAFGVPEQSASDYPSSRAAKQAMRD